VTSLIERARAHHPGVAITDLGQLRAALQTAIELEHSTIPPYLCALYSIEPGHNVEAAAIIQSVVMEEMLHLVIAANLLNAIGGAPDIDRPDFIPRYPATLPHSDGRVVLELLPFSPQAIAGFLRVERPEPPARRPRAEGYHTIGQFYAAIVQGFEVVAAKEQIFTGEPSRQVAGNGRVYGTAGDAVPVHDLETALEAMTIVVDQGEGIDHTIHDGDSPLGEGLMLAHYYRFDEIARRRRYRASDTPITGPTGPPLPVDYEAAWPMRANPRAGDLPPGSEVRALTDELNAVYSGILRHLHRGLNGEQEHLAEAVGSMWALRWKAEALMRVPVGDAGQTAGPSFEWVR
jgi:hypothetical protein